MQIENFKTKSCLYYYDDLLLMIDSLPYIDLLLLYISVSHATVIVCYNVTACREHIIDSITR